MMLKKKCVFTICAKNYLAQALTLKDSISHHNKDTDFFIFLADEKTDDLGDQNVCEIDESWLPGWKTLAFKYNVIEFATSIKPFCFSKLFNEGYEKVIYLDPDIFVTDTLDYIFDSLDLYSMVITPHYNHIETHFTGAVSEEELLFVGIYNLGFGAIKNNQIGAEIVSWWKNRLYNKCYADKEDALHVDQKWIDFLPAFFPEEILISHHPGVNIAIWNLHERILLVDNGKYIIEDLRTKKSYPLIFFHFSGFDPYDRTVINRRHPKFNVEIFPSFLPIINEYADTVYRNQYEVFSVMKYSFNNFKDGDVILPLHRRLYRIYAERVSDATDPFRTEGPFYKLLRSRNLIMKNDQSDYNLGIRKESKIDVSRIDKIFTFSAKIFIYLFGIKRYFFLIKYLRMKTRLENQEFLIDIK